MRTNYIPAGIMLLAGLVDCVIAFGKHMETGAFIKELLIVLIIFFFIGLLIRSILEKALKAFADKTEPEEEGKKKGDKDTQSAKDSTQNKEKKNSGVEEKAESAGKVTAKENEE